MQHLDEEALVRAISLHRHDWMNDIQLISGYLKLKKYDKLHEFVETMMEKTNKQSNWFRIGVPGLVLCFYMFQAENPHLQLELQTSDSVPLKKCFSGQDRLLELVSWLLGLYGKTARDDGERMPFQLTIGLANGQELMMESHLRGKYDRDKMAAEFNRGIEGWKRLLPVRHELRLEPHSGLIRLFIGKNQ